MTPSKITQVRGVDPAAWDRARKDAQEKGLWMGKWIAIAIETYLNFEERAEAYCRGKGWREPR